jgi:hypothetical protein
LNFINFILVKERKGDSALVDKVHDKTESKRAAKEEKGSISQYPALITDKKGAKASSKIEITNKEKKKKREIVA